MEYLTAKQTSENWGITLRRVQELCRTGQIGGAVRWGRDWMIPADVPRPIDRRRREHKNTDTKALMPRRSPFIAMTDIYSVPGSADRVLASLSDMPETAALFEAQIALYRGEIDRVYDMAHYFLSNSFTYNMQVGAGILLSRCALFKSDVGLWRDAKRYISEAPCKTEAERIDLTFWQAVADSGINDIVNFPKWFCRGSFDPLPRDSYPAARFYYLKYLYTSAHQEALNNQDLISGMTLMHLLPLTAEPLISQTRSEGALLAEIYLLLTCAIAYHISGNDNLAAHRVDRAIKLALPDRLYVPLAEHRRYLDFLLDERLAAIDPSAVKPVRALGKTMQDGWTVLHNTILDRTVTAELTTREREVARLAAYGLSNRAISERLNISINSVKHALRMAMDKTTAVSRNELKKYV